MYLLLEQSGFVNPEALSIRCAHRQVWIPRSRTDNAVTSSKIHLLPPDIPSAKCHDVDDFSLCRTPDHN